MAKRPWLEAVQRRLVAERLPQRYIRRFMDELADHYHDVMEDTMNERMDAERAASRLGVPDQVADAAATEYRRRTFFGRHPSAKFFIFGVSPMVAMLSTFVVACLSVIAFAEVCEMCGCRLSAPNRLGGVDPNTLGGLISFLTTIVPAAILTYVYCRFAIRLEIGRRWMLVACCVLAFVAMLPFQSVAISDMPGKSMWTIGLSNPHSVMQCVQLSIPLVVGLWFAGRYHNRQSLNNVA